MSLNLLSLTSRVVSLLGLAGAAASQAGTIVNAMIVLVETAETIADDLKGSDKLAAVKAGLKTVVEDLGLAGEFDRFWKGLAPLVSLVVTIYNLKGLWPKPAEAGSTTRGLGSNIGGVASGPPGH